MNTRKARSVALFSEAAPTYNTVGPPFFSDFARKLVEFADIAGDEDILDVATGTGVVLLEAVGHVRSETRLVGVDLTPAMLARAAAEVERRGLPGIDLQLMDAESLSFGTRASTSFSALSPSPPSQTSPRRSAGLSASCARVGEFAFWIPPIGTSTTTHIGHGTACCSNSSRSLGRNTTFLLVGRASYPISSWPTVSATSSSLKRPKS